MTVMCIQTFNRLDYLRQALNALKQCDGIEDYVLYASCEPGFKDIVTALESASFFKKVLVHVNPSRFGLCKNTKHSTIRALRHADQIVGMEDDIILMPDALRYLEWGLHTYKDDPKIWSIGCDNLLRSKEEAGQLRPDTVHRRAHFSCWGWAMWKNRYEQLFKEWPDDKKSWAMLSGKAQHKRGLMEIYPEVSRSIQIGEVGMHMRKKCSWFKEYIKGETSMRAFVGQEPETYKERPL